MASGVRTRLPPELLALAPILLSRLADELGLDDRVVTRAGLGLANELVADAYGRGVSDGDQAGYERGYQAAEQAAHDRPTLEVPALDSD